MKRTDPYTKAGAALSELYISLRLGFLSELGDDENIFGGVIQDPVFCRDITKVAIEHARRLIKSLPYLISTLELNFVDREINEDNFTWDLVDTLFSSKSFRLFSFKKHLFSKEVIPAMEKEGYRPATIREKLRWAVRNWNGFDCVIALGSFWLHPNGPKRFSLLCFNEGRKLTLRCDDEKFGTYIKFLGVKK